MLDVNTSTMTQYFHQPHTLHASKDANGGNKPTRGGIPAYDYGKILFQQGPPLNAYIGTPDTMHPLPKTTQTGFWSVGENYGTQSLLNSHPAPIAQINGRRHTTGSLNTPTSSPIGKSQMMTFFLEPVGGHPSCGTLPTSGSGSTGGNVVKPNHPIRRVGALKRSRSQSMADNQLWKDLEQAESLHKSLRVDRIDPSSPYGPSNKHSASRNRLVKQISRTFAETLEENHVKQREVDSVSKKGGSLHCLRESSPPKKRHVNKSEFETHPLFASQQGPLTKKKVTMITTRMPPTPRMHLLNHVCTTQLANNEPYTELQRKQGRKMSYYQREVGYIPDNAAVRFEKNPTLYEKEKHEIQLTCDHPKINTRVGPMTNTKNKGHPLTHPYSVTQPCSDNIEVLYHTQTFTEGPGSHPQLNRASCLPSFPIKDGSHLVDHKFVNPLQSHHDKIRQKLRYEIQCKRMAIRQQRSNLVKARYSRSIPVIHHPSIPPEGIHTQSNDQLSNLVDPFFTRNKQGDASIIPMPTLNRRPRITQNGNLSSFKSQQNNLFSAVTDTSISKRGDLFPDFPIINKYQTLKEETNTGNQTERKLGPREYNFIRGRPDAKHGIHSNYLQRKKSVKYKKKPVGEGSSNIKRKKGPGEKEAAQHTRNPLSTIRQVIGPNGYVSPITYGEFLKDIVVPMTLAVSNKDKKNQEKFASLVKFWQNQADQIQSDSLTGVSKIANNSPISDRPTNVAKSEELRTLLLIDSANKPKSASRDDSMQEKEIKEIVKDVVDHENQTVLEDLTIIGPSNKSNSSPISDTHLNFAKAEDIRTLLLIERANKQKRARRPESIHEEETKEIVKDVTGHENQTALEARTIVGPNKISNSIIPGRSSNVIKAEDLRTLLLIESANKLKREGRTKENVKDVGGHESQTALEARTIVGPSKKSNSSPISERPPNVSKAEDLRALLLTERANKPKRADRDDSIQEEETKQILKDVVVHENQTALEARTVIKPSKKSNSSPISDGPSNVAKAQDLRTLSLTERANKPKRANVDNSIQEEEAKEILKDVVGHENQNALEARIISTWDQQIISSTSSALTGNTATITEENLPIEETQPTEKHDEESSSISKTPRIKSVRVVLRTSDQIRMKFYNIGSSRPDKPRKIRGRKRKHKRRKYMKKKKILMRIGSETLFTRSLYCSSISPRKHAGRRKKGKVKEKTKTYPTPPKDFNRIALSVHKHEGETILHRAVRVNAKEVLLYCLGNNIGEINARDNAGYTPLHECCVFDKVWMAEKLILHGADVNASAHDGTRPIHDAVENHKADMTRLLLSYGADPLLPTYAKRTALDNATSFEIVTLLHEYLRDLNGESDELPRLLKSSNNKRRTLRFRSSVATQENEQRTDSFFDTSELNETTQEGQNAIFYLKEIPQPKHIRLKLKENEMVKTWYLLSDVLARLKIPAATFPYLYPHVKVNGLPTSIFLKKIEQVPALNQFDFAALCGERELVEFVEADDEMCSILQLEGWTSHE